jgi:hypothetical protein
LVLITRHAENPRRNPGAAAPGFWLLEPVNGRSVVNQKKRSGQLAPQFPEPELVKCVVIRAVN